MRDSNHFRYLLIAGLLGSAGLGYLFAQMNGENPVVSRPAVADQPTTQEAPINPEDQRNIALFQRSSPAVVNINTLDRRMDLYSRQVLETARGSGSGFVWDNDGHIVTNYHVIQGASGAQVILDDNTVYRAQLVGVSPDHDLAVLKIDMKDQPTTPLPLGDSDALQVGQTVFAIGNPFGLDHTLTKGIISALGREITAVSGQQIADVVQTDAAINPGNSGGPLLDANGRVIGVNTAIFSPSGASNGIGFAVPIGTVRRVVPQLIEFGEYRRPDLGIRMDERISQRLLSQVGAKGVLVLGIEPGSGAESAGLIPTRRAENGAILLGDIIESVNGKQVSSVSDLQLILDSLRPGQTVSCHVRRGKQTVADIDVVVR